MEAYDPATVYSSIDHGGRYAYGNQPVVAEWNLARLAEALLPLFEAEQERAVALAVEALGGFRGQYEGAWSAGMRAKLGLPDGSDEAAVSTLVEDLLALLRTDRVDHTSFYRALAGGARGGDAEPVRRLFLDPAALDAWLARWRALEPDPEAMRRVNPAYIPRNHLVEAALAAAIDGDMGPLDGLLDAVTTPFDERPGLDRYAAPAPDGSGAYRTFCGT
jgi:uncharacterized protein YdiU (UPF0061 family)